MENNTYEPINPKNNPNDIDKKKYPETECSFILFFNDKWREILGKCKMDNHYKAEILYTIGKERPSDLQEGIPKIK